MELKEFIKESELEYISMNKTCKLYLGKAHEVFCNLEKVDQKKLSGYDVEEYEYRISNLWNEEIDVKINPFTQPSRLIISSSHVFRQLSANQVELWLKVKPRGEERIRLRYKMDRELSAG
ncbi:MAG: hypothetical protein AWM53_01551 [Candidatus Dichloromethanomonas elyunquensis]|nr:MAG: hypothetical protein AWM53_01551 [Candidatus Dichloromethanomonas elyunquensis]